MQAIKPCNTYSARPAGTAVFRHGRTNFKVYYVDISGRSQPERYEWDRCGHSREGVPDSLAKVGVEGVGAVISFPHITKVFRFAPSAETIMQVRAFLTPDFSAVDLGREEGYMEFACYAEAIIAAEEYRFWAEARSVEEYLERWVRWWQAPVLDNRKMERYFSTEASG